MGNYMAKLEEIVNRKKSARRCRAKLAKLEEILFRKKGAKKRQGSSNKTFDIDMALRSHSLNKMDKKKSVHTGTMKPMSAHDEKTLNTAVALANEITTKSMNDLDGEKVPSSPNDRSKFHFKFPLVSLHYITPLELEKDAVGRQERRNFSEEANSVPDIQSTITEECKLAYTSLIEHPTPSSSLISHIKDGSLRKPSTIPKQAPLLHSKPEFRSLQKQLSYKARQNSTSEVEREAKTTQNELPLPPRTSKTKLVDKPRHIRKYPLKLANKTNEPNVEPLQIRTNIYQNAVPCHAIAKFGEIKVKEIVENKGVDVFDGADKAKVDTNPFTNTSGASSANPFNVYLETIDVEKNEERAPVIGAQQDLEEGSLVRDCTDHVSVEDLLEFADQKPCGRQRGVESDEVRIMCKVLKQQVTPEQCLEALELSDWNVHNAIKLMRVKMAVGAEVKLEDCRAELAKANGDIVKASAVFVLCKNEGK